MKKLFLRIAGIASRSLLRSLPSVLCLLFLSVLCSSAQQFISFGNFGGATPLAFTGAGVTNARSPAVNFASNCAWFCTSAKGLGTPRIQYLTVAGDLVDAATGTLNSYFSTNQSTITNASISGSNQIWLDCTGFASNDVIVIQSKTLDNYQRCIVTNNFNVIPAANTNNALQIWPSLAFATTVGDIVYKETPGAFLPCSCGTFNTNYTGAGGAVFYGRAGQPLLIDLNFSNSAAIKSVVGDYIPNRDR